MTTAKQAISLPSTPAAVSDWARRVLEVLRTRCGAAGLAELARATGLEELLRLAVGSSIRTVAA
jgi:hypothetical protein